MKKIYLLLLCLFLISGCTQSAKKNVNTIIEEEKNVLIAINYPITTYQKLDKIIKKDVEKIYNEFKNNYENFDILKKEAELNIDYEMHTIDTYTNITLHTFINSSTLAHPINKILTYVYDIKNKKLLSIDDILEKESMPKLATKAKELLLKKYKDCILLDEMKATVTSRYHYPLFTIDEEELTIYFNPSQITASYCDIIDIQIPFTYLESKIKIESELEMPVITEVKKPIKVIDPNQKVVALTFDDGPGKYTKDILKILKENDACATFFVIGNKVSIYSDTLREMIQNGNEIGNHSYNHKWLTKLTDEDLHEQITQTQEIIKKETGFVPTLIRPTYGSISDSLRKKIPLQIVMWTVDTRDWKYHSINPIVKKGTKVKDLDIILMHDTHKRTLDAIKKIVPELKKQGYELVTVSELNEIKLLRNHKTN